jgi:hypothetical protein
MVAPNPDPAVVRRAVGGGCRPVEPRAQPKRPWPVCLPHPPAPQDFPWRTGQGLQAEVRPCVFKPPAPVPQHPLQMEGPEVLKLV